MSTGYDSTSHSGRRGAKRIADEGDASALPKVPSVLLISLLIFLINALDLILQGLVSKKTRRIRDDSTASSSEPVLDSASRLGVSEHENDEAKVRAARGLESNAKPAGAAGTKGKRLGRSPAAHSGSKVDAAPKVPPARQRLIDYMRELKRHVPSCFNAMRWAPQQVHEYLLKTDSAEFAPKMLDEV